MTDHHIRDLNATAETLHGLNDDLTVDEAQQRARDLVANDTAYYIANVIIPTNDSLWPGVIGGKDMPRDVAEIKAALLDGRVWISWMNDTVTTAMRQLHGEPTGDARLFAADAAPERCPRCNDPIEDHIDPATGCAIWARGAGGEVLTVD